MQKDPDIIDINNRWLPPSPHKEAVIEFVRKGRAHIEERGHNIPPLLVFEDGGVMELPRVRYKDGQFSPDETVAVSRQTRFNDVCGTINEFEKQISSEEPPDRTELLLLLDDVCYLLSRMQRRREQYQSALQSVANIVEKMKEIAGPDVEIAYEKADQIRLIISEHHEELLNVVEKLISLSEEIREVANRMEKEVLYPFRDLFIELGDIYEQVKGSRIWKKQK